MRNAMDVVPEESQDEPPSVLHELMNLGQTHFDIFAIINGFIKFETRRAVAGCCSSARALVNRAVNSVRVFAPAQPVRRDLAEVFPHATDLDLVLTENEEGQPCDSVSAAQSLQNWSIASQRLLAQLKNLGLSFTLAAMMETKPTVGFHAAMVDLLGRWVVLASASHQGQTFLLPCFILSQSGHNSSLIWGREVVAPVTPQESLPVCPGLGVSDFLVHAFRPVAATAH
jgi:hypothetical protein